MKYCIVCKNNYACFSKEGTKITHCEKCKENCMVNISKKCVICKLTTASYGNIGYVRPTRCVNHKEPSMINLKHKMCFCGKSRPNFGKKGYKPTHCANCKDNDMVDVVNKMCYCGKSQPSFGKKGCRPTHCVKCKKSNMINVSRKMCFCGKSQPYFGVEGSVPSHCSKCKESDMVDIVNKRCKENGCRKIACYANPNVLPEYCLSHKKVGMISNPRKRCEGGDDGDCKETAIYGKERDRPIHCEEHKLEDEYNLAERECVNPECKKIDVLNKDGLCVNFCSLEERDRLMKKQIKKHEEKIGNVLKEEIDLPFTYRDEVVDKSCSNKRPDFVYHCGTHIVIVEVDENQHKSYKCTAYGDNKEGKMKGENIRMFEIAQSFDGLPVVFLRYNPDNYKVNGVLGKYATSKRHDLLVKWIRKCLRERIDGFNVKYLFYDEFSETDSSFKDIKEEDVV